jgi:hypothetical protein
MKRKTHYTSLAATLGVGAELSRRGYDVAFTIGNTPRIDLLCDVPDGVPFKIQVKGISTKNAFWVQKTFFDAVRQDDLFLIVVLVPYDVESAFRFFILSHHDAQQAFSKMPTEKKDGRPYEGGSGLTWGVIQPYENAWNKLPDVRTTFNVLAPTGRRGRTAARRETSAVGTIDL